MELTNEQRLALHAGTRAGWRVQRAQSWFVEHDTLIGPLASLKAMSNIAPFDGELPELEPYDDSSIEN